MSVKLIEGGGLLNFINEVEGGFSSIELDADVNAIVFTNFEGDKSAIVVQQTKYQNSGSAFFGTLLASALFENVQYSLPNTGGNIALETGINFDGVVTNLTVVNGIVTAIS